jgi:hypothetical protein
MGSEIIQTALLRPQRKGLHHAGVVRDTFSSYPRDSMGSSGVRDVTPKHPRASVVSSKDKQAAGS